MLKKLNRRVLCLQSLSLIVLVVAQFSGAAFSADSNDVVLQHVEAAKGYMNAGQWTFANYEWRAALAQSPRNVEANIGLAETLMQSGFLPDAISHLEEVRQSVHKLSLELTYGKALEMAKDFSAAKEVYLRNVEKVPLESKSITRLLAILPYLSESEQKSLKDYLETLATDSAKNGRDALKKKNFVAAAENLEVSTMLNRRIADINDYGLALLLLGRYDEAFTQFSLLTREKKDSWEVFANSALVSLGKGNPFGAAKELEKAIGLCEDASKKPLLYNDLGFVYESQNNWQKARTAYERAVELDPRFLKAKLNLAYAYQKDMAYEEAIKIYQAILLQEPNNAMVLNRLGFVYELANKERLAAQAYRRATEVKPNEQDGYYNLAILYKKMGKQKESDLAYKQLMDIEFHKMETGRKANKLSKQELSSKEKNNRDLKNSLLDYVDVFFSSPTPST